MDTRTKIKSASEIRQLVRDGQWSVAVGFFDPLTISEARRIEASKQGAPKLLAIVLDQPQTLLSAEARAVLVAALRAVDAVAIAHTGNWRALLPSGGILNCSFDPSGDGARSTEFVDLVLSRST